MYPGKIILGYIHVIPSYKDRNQYFRSPGIQQSPAQSGYVLSGKRPQKDAPERSAVQKFQRIHFPSSCPYSPFILFHFPFHPVSQIPPARQ